MKLRIQKTTLSTVAEIQRMIGDLHTELSLVADDAIFLEGSKDDLETVKKAFDRISQETFLRPLISLV